MHIYVPTPVGFLELRSMFYLLTLDKSESPNSNNSDECTRNELHMPTL